MSDKQNRKCIFCGERRISPTFDFRFHCEGGCHSYLLEKGHCPKNGSLATCGGIDSVTLRREMGEAYLLEDIIKHNNSIDGVVKWSGHSQFREPRHSFHHQSQDQHIWGPSYIL